MLDPHPRHVARRTVADAQQPRRIEAQRAAEGVETAAAWHLLRELKCDQAQGYHMGRPMPVSEFSAWTASWGMRRAAVDNDSAPLLH